MPQESYVNDRPKNTTMVKDKEGRLLTKDDEIRKGGETTLLRC